MYTLDILLKYTFHPKYKRKRYIYNCVSKVLRNNDNNNGYINIIVVIVIIIVIIIIRIIKCPERIRIF